MLGFASLIDCLALEQVQGASLEKVNLSQRNLK